jgi:hypothetical protein
LNNPQGCDDYAATFVISIRLSATVVKLFSEIFQIFSKNFHGAARRALCGVIR